MFNSIKFKISVLYTFLLGIILLIFSGILYFSLYYTLYEEIDAALKIKVYEINKIFDSYINIIGNDQEAKDFIFKRTIRFEGKHPEQQKLRAVEKEWLRIADKYDLRQDYILIYNDQGELVVNSTNIGDSIFKIANSNLELLSHDDQIFSNINVKKRKYRAIDTVLYTADGERYIIRIATSLKPTMSILGNRVFFIILTIPIILLLSSFFGLVIAKRILTPVMEITNAARRITHEDFSARVKDKNIDVEMKYLVDSFNEMISRLEQSFEYVAEFSSHVAHELKTPLAIMRGESEMVLQKDRDVEEYKRVINVSLEEIKRMLKTIDDLLLLTRLECSPEYFSFERFNLASFVSELSEQIKLVAADKNITVSYVSESDSIYINGDRHHIRRMLLNLLHNAVKFTLSGGSIVVVLSQDNAGAVISIKDSGIGIAKKDLNKIFNKFFHINRTGNELEPGNGLGLSIADTIVKIHRGRIDVQSEIQKGSTFTVYLPKA
ncbi:MAG: ATP-binding protein [bacterium]